MLRRHDAATIDARDEGVLRPGDAEIKRMWVDPAHRRRGVATAVLAELEGTARAAGCGRTVLETGTEQPEALAFYGARGYVAIPRYGTYRDEPSSLCFARGLAPPP
ncbi:GNAT family N-acetyltransferase [Actinomycetospora aeridis]|uniref:GNAT family N-acetyltransferase n=1 Tax=Actinomycetospora aeridis TaxID=3129231 RepID=A0ABU8NCC7_9PSEU